MQLKGKKAQTKLYVMKEKCFKPNQCIKSDNLKKIIYLDILYQTVNFALHKLMYLFFDDKFCKPVRTMLTFSKLIN